MKLTNFTKMVLAYKKEKRDMEAQGYYGHGVTLSGTEKIKDVVVAKDGKSIWIKTASE